MHTTLYFSINILLPPTSRRYFLIIFFDLLMDTYLEDDEGTGRKGDGLCKGGGEANGKGLPKGSKEQRPYDGRLEAREGRSHRKLGTRDHAKGRTTWARFGPPTRNTSRDDPLLQSGSSGSSRRR